MTRRPGIDPELLSAAFDHELTAAEQARLAAVADEPAVRAELDRLAATRSALRRALPDQDPSPQLWSRIRRGLDEIDATPATAPAPVDRRFPFRRRLLAVAGIAFVLLLAPVIRRAQDAPAPATGGWQLNPTHLAASHRYWQDRFAGERATLSPEQMAATLSQKLNTPVAPPDLVKLHARLIACATCDHAMPGRVVALFVMQSEDGADLTLFETWAAEDRLRVEGFQPLDGLPGVLVAEADGLAFASVVADGLRTTLASSTLAPRALASLVAEAADRPHLVKPGGQST